jgi:hypothetical protein
VSDVIHKANELITAYFAEEHDGQEEQALREEIVKTLTLDVLRRNSVPVAVEEAVKK